jgi:hypothetical protein
MFERLDLKIMPLLQILFLVLSHPSVNCSVCARLYTLAASC